ncbi:MAG: M48 family metallopeptidase [Planctomycetales bacterium]|nr:M48 family metallopeptidase [Planctomycetales bacterium]
MGTDFFQRQENARKSTVWLIAMFVLAVATIVVCVFAIAAIIVQTQMPELGTSLDRHPEQVVIPTLASGLALIIVLGGTAYKVLDLRAGGGARVAESLGGKRLFPNSSNHFERRLLNVVEEMALASGTAVPPVFLLEEEGINAFAAGYSPSDAVLGVTRGCAERLSRDELQGVIGHEFSHVLNGDMRMSIRMIGILHGILLIGLTGQLILRTFFHSGTSRRRSNDKNGGQVVLVIITIGVAAIVLGYIGTFFGNLIKAAVSRQREYLADASAVQFTRNPSGIADALKRIGASAVGSQLKAANAAQASHMYFAQGVWEGFSGLWSTHPPLTKRIQAIEPSWDGSFDGFDTPAASDSGLPHRSARSSSSGVQVAELSSFESTQNSFANTPGFQNHTQPNSVPVQIVDRAVSYVGEPSWGHRHYAADVIASLPILLLDAVHEPYGARAVVYALLLDSKPNIRKTQLHALERCASGDVVQLIRKLVPLVDSLDIKARLPLIDMSLPALKSMSSAQYSVFQNCFAQLVKADNKLNLFEWMLSQVLMRHLSGQYERIPNPRMQYYALHKLSRECSILLSTVAHVGNDETRAKRAFQLGQKALPEVSLTWFDVSPTEFDDIREILLVLSRVTTKHRIRLVDACAEVICADNNVTWKEAELLRGISDLLDCPMPPLLVAVPPPV